MKIKEMGKEHEAGNRNCTACDQRGIDGAQLSTDISHYPYMDTSGNPPCGGLVHAEIFGNEQIGWEILYQCDKCGAPAEALLEVS